LPTDIARARQIWQQANAQVAEFPRGHIDILRWEAQNPGAPATETPASTGPALSVAEAVRLSLRQRPDLFAHADMNALERAAVQRAYAAHVQAVHSAWAQAVAARHSLLRADEALSAARTGVALGQRMVQAGNWSWAKLLREQLTEAAAQQAAARAQAAQTRANEHLAQLLGLWDSAALADLLQGLPASLPALPPTLQPGQDAQGADIAPSEIEAAVLRSDPTLAWQRTELQRLQQALPPQRLAHWAQALDKALGADTTHPAQGSPWQAPTLYDLPLLRDHALAKAVQAEAQLLQAATQRRSMAREAWAQLQAAYAHALHAQNILAPLQATLEQETLLRYNGMLQSTWDLLAQARERMAALDAAHQARRDFWLAHAAWQALLAGGDDQSPGLASAAASRNPTPEGH
jgi:hypothetical protein